MVGAFWAWFKRLDDGAMPAIESAKLSRGWARALVAMGVLLYLGALSSKWFPCRDGAAYLLIGRNLAEGRGWVMNGTPAQWYSPGLPIFWSLVTRTWGEQYLVSSVFQVSMALLSCLAVWLAARRMGGERLAALVALTLLFSHNVMRNTVVAQTDLAFLALFSWTVAGLRLCLDGKKWGLALAAASLSAGLFFRMPGCLAAPWLALGFVLEGARLRPAWRWGSLAVMVAAPAAVVAWYWSVRNDGGSGGYVRMASFLADLGPWDLLGRFGKSAALTPQGLLRLLLDMSLPGLLFLPCAALAALGVLHEARAGRHMMPLVCAGHVVSMNLVMGISGPSRRYLLPILPWMIYFTFLGLAMVAERLAARWERLTPRRVILGAAALLILVGAARSMEDLVRIHRSEGPWVEEAHWPAVHDLCVWLRQNTAERDTVLARESVVIAYWTRRPAIELSSQVASGPQAVVDAIEKHHPRYVAVHSEEADPAALGAALAGRYIQAAQVGPYAVFRGL